MRISKGIQAPDFAVMAIYAVLVAIGWFNIYATQNDTTSIFDISRKHGAQIMWIIIAVLSAATVLIISSKVYSVFAYYLYGIVILLLIMVLFTGVVVNSSKSWLSLGPLRFQPAELAKLATSLTLAAFMSRYEFKMNKFENVIYIIAIIIIPVTLILLQRDWGSAMVFSAFLLMLYREGMSGWVLVAVGFAASLFIATLIFPTIPIVIAISIITLLLYAVYDKSTMNAFKALGITVAIFAFFVLIKRAFNINYDYDILLLASGATTIIIAIFVSFFKHLIVNYYLVLFFFGALLTSYSVDYVYANILKPHHRDRLEIVLGMKEDFKGVGYNVHQSKVAIGSGGFMGKGYLQGTQTKLNFVPEQSTDFIFCTIGEEWGFMGTVFLILLYLTLLLRILFLAERQKHSFARIYGYCVASVLFFHFAVNIAMTIGLFPVIGIPLPFISAGGSSLWSFTILLFIFLKLDSVRYGGE